MSLSHLESAFNGTGYRYHISLPCKILGSPQIRARAETVGGAISAILSAGHAIGLSADGAHRLPCAKSTEMPAARILAC